MYRTPLLAIASSVALAFCATTASAQITPYTQDFEGLNQQDPNALANDGWLVFGNVFDGTTGNYMYGYGPFPAPNGGPAFCGITSGQGGPAQGNQQLVVYSDYNNTDHANGHIIESNVFQEWTVGAGDVGKTYEFVFDVKMGDLQPNSTAAAFIKVIDNTTFGLSGFVTVDLTNTSTLWSTNSLQITLDASQVGHFFQIGFMNTATNYTPSGVIYDNVDLHEVVPPPGTAFCFGDGTGIPCPCGNNSPNAGSGCDNGTGSGGAVLSTSGSDSVAAGDLVLQGAGLEPNQPGLYFQGNNAINGGNGAVFGDGIRCAGGGVVRLQVRVADGTGNSATSINIASKGGVAAGDVRRYQLWYRNPNNTLCGTGFNLTNGIEITWAP